MFQNLNKKIQKNLLTPPQKQDMIFNRPCDIFLSLYGSKVNRNVMMNKNIAPIIFIASVKAILYFTFCIS